MTDDGNGLFFMRNRFYDPNVGKFTQPDPIRLDGGDVNLSRYVSNNPLSEIDPSGLITDSACAKAKGIRVSSAIYQDEDLCIAKIPPKFGVRKDLT